MSFSFAKYSSADSLELVPEKYRPLYVEKEGKFVLMDPVKALAAEFDGVQTQLVSLNQSRKDDNSKDAARRHALNAVKESLSKLGWEPGDDIAEIPALIESKVAELIEANKSGGKIKADIEAITAASNKKIKEVEDAAGKEQQSMLTALTKHMIDGEAARHLALAGATQEGITLLMPQMRVRAKVFRDESGEYNTQVLDEAGSPAFSTKEVGRPMGMGELVEAMKTTFPSAFKSEMMPGTGTKPTQTSSKGTTVAAKPAGEKSSIQKIADGIRSGTYQNR